MKVLENNYKDKTMVVTCYNCKSKIEFKDSELKTNGQKKYFICPCCGTGNVHLDGVIDFNSVEESENNCDDEKVLTIYNFKFPDDFNEFNSKNEDTVSIKNKEIEKWIKECCKYLSENEDEYFRYIASGDTMVIVFALEEDNGEKHNQVIVAKGYYETEIL